MKNTMKWIALASMMSLFALPAFATGGGTTGSSDQSSTDQSAGTMGTSPSQDQSAQTPPQSETDTMGKSADMKSGDKMSAAKTCTDENGVTYYKGRPGFDRCISKMKKKDEMGGTVGSDTSETSKGDTSSSDSQMSGSSSNSSGSESSS